MMKQSTAFLLAAAGGMFAYLVARDALPKIGQAVDITSPENVAYKGTTKVVRAVTGDEHATLGTKLWEWLNPAAVQKEKELTTVSNKLADPGTSWGP